MPQTKKITAFFEQSEKELPSETKETKEENVYLMALNRKFNMVDKNGVNLVGVEEQCGKSAENAVSNLTL